MGCISAISVFELFHLAKTLWEVGKKNNIKTHPGTQTLSKYPVTNHKHTHTSNNTAIIISAFSQKHGKHRRSRFYSTIGSWERAEAGFWGEQNLWTVHFSRAGPLSAALFLGGCLVVLSLSQTTTTTCLCWICAHAAGLWLRHKHAVNR